METDESILSNIMKKSAQIAEPEDLDQTSRVLEYKISNIPMDTEMVHLLSQLVGNTPEFKQKALHLINKTLDGAYSHRNKIIPNS